MGSPSSGADYVENRLSLDERFIHKPSATYYMKLQRLSTAVAL